MVDIDDELQRLFLESAREQLDLIGSALEADDADGVSRGAHSLKGSAGMCDAPSLHELAQSVEAYATAGQLGAVSALLERMETALASHIVEG